MSNEQRSGARPVQKTSSTGNFGLLLVFIALAGAIGLYLVTGTKTVEAEAESEPTVEPVSPFADLPPETPPEKQAKGKGEQ